MVSIVREYGIGVLIAIFLASIAAYIAFILPSGVGFFMLIALAFVSFCVLWRLQRIEQIEHDAIQYCKPKEEKDVTCPYYLIEQEV